MQIKPFSNGGGVIHKIVLDAAIGTRYSAWFDTEGRLIDAESHGPVTSRSVKRGTKTWEAIKRRFPPTYVIEQFEKVSPVTSS